MKLVFVQAVNEIAFGGSAVCYMGRDYEKADNSQNVNWINLKNSYEQRSDHFLEEIKEWHCQLNQLGAKEVSHWFFQAFSRLISWQPETLQVYYFFQSIKDLNPKVEKLYVINATEDLKRFYFRKIKRPSSILYWGRFFKYLTDLLISVFRKNDSIPKVSNTLIFSDILNPEIYEKDGDHFYGNLVKENVTWLYFDDPLKGKFTKEAIVLKSLLKYSDIFRLFVEAFLYRRQVKRFLLKLSPLKSDQDFLTYEYMSQLGIDAFPYREFVIFHTLKRIKDQYKFLIYPFEDKPQERAMLMAFGKERSLGYAHPVHGVGHLYLRDSKSSWAIRPKYFLSTGEIPKLQMVERGLKPCFNIGSKRFHEGEILYKPFERKLLFLINNPVELIAIENYLIGLGNFLNRYKIIIRNHPHISNELQDMFLKDLQFALPKVTFKPNDQSLIEQAKWSDITFFCSTSAGFETILAGCYTLNLNLSNWLKVDLLPEHRQINTIDELRSEIIRYMAMNEQEYAYEMRELQQKAQAYFSPFKIETLSKDFPNIFLPSGAVE